MNMPSTNNAQARRAAGAGEDAGPFDPVVLKPRTPTPLAERPKMPTELPVDSRTTPTLGDVPLTPRAPPLPKTPTPCASGGIVPPISPDVPKTPVPEVDDVVP
jgi:hypothetical protein